jgi:hypothetical protein
VHSAEGFLSYTLSSTATTAFNKCVHDFVNAGGMHIEVTQMTPSIANLDIHWVLPNGVKPPTQVSLSVVGGTVVSKPVPVKWSTSGEASVGIRRQTNQDLSLSANATAVDGSPISGDALLIPAYVNWIRNISRVDRFSERSFGYCGGNGDGYPKVGSPASVGVLANNERLLIDQARWDQPRVGSEVPPPQDDRALPPKFVTLTEAGGEIR